MRSYNPAQMKVQQVQSILTAAVAPRPIAFASTVDKDGNPNLSPFSFFNAFGANPVTLVFSPSRRGRDNTVKHTLENLREVPEVVINVVNFDMVEQANLASHEYEKGVNEFVKAGFTTLESEVVKPFRVKESPVQFECTVNQIIEMGTEGGAGNLVVCTVVRMHVDENVLDENDKIDPNLIDLVGRMGGDLYIRTSGEALFEVQKPGLKKGIGMDALPGFLKNSKYLSGNELAKLASLESLPENVQMEDLSYQVQQQLKTTEKDPFCLAKELLETGEIEEAARLFIWSQGKMK